APAPPTPGAPPARTQQGAPGAAAGAGPQGPQPPGAQSPEFNAKVQAGLDAIDREEARYLSNGQIMKEEAELVAAKVKRDHPVFKSLTVVDGGPTWDYDYEVNPHKKKPGKTKEEKAAEAKTKADAKAKEKEDKAKAKADAKAAAKAEADKAKREAAAKVIDKYKARLEGGKVKGEFGNFDYGGYGFQSAVPPYHPANIKLKMPVGPAIPPPKTGTYTIGDAMERETGGAEWHKILNGERRDKKSGLNSLLSAELNKEENRNADEQRKKSLVVGLAGLRGEAQWEGKVADAGTSLAMLIDQIAMHLLEKDYEMPFQDINLDGWDNHHLWPLDWGGDNDFGNLMFIRRGEHTPITNWWQARKRLLQQSLEALESIPVAPVPAAPGAVPST
ncbi:MAG TPA: hypothetical protein VF586_22355, partial [Pyrinomonadaceae bacterium]